MVIEEGIATLSEVAARKPGLEALREIRSLLASDDFAVALADAAMRAHNDADAGASLGRSLQALKFLFKDQAEARREQHRQMHILAVGAGSALGVGAVLALVDLVAGLSADRASPVGCRRLRCVARIARRNPLGIGGCRTR